MDPKVLAKPFGYYRDNCHHLPPVCLDRMYLLVHLCVYFFEEMLLMFLLDV